MQSPQIRSSFGISICRILMDCADHHSIGTQRRSFHDGLKMNASRSFLRMCSCVRRLRLHPIAVFPVNVESQGSNSTMLIDLDFDMCSIASLRYEESENEARESLLGTDDAASCPAEEAREAERRRKIGLANKGRVPWNKGRPHTPETRERIKQRTIEAMRNPKYEEGYFTREMNDSYWEGGIKVRNRMSESPRRHSEEVKTKISSSLRQLWGERLKCKRAKEKLYRSWAENVAEAARKGGVNEDELSWDSYGKMKREIDLRNLEHAIEKAKAKERKRTRAGRKTQKKAKKARLSQKIAESETKEAPIKRPRKKHQNPNVVEEEMNLKARLTKIQRKKSVKGQTSSQMPTTVSCYPYLERLDLQFIEREKMRMKVSLADEIRAAKNRRSGSTGCEALTTSFRLEE